MSDRYRCPECGGEFPEPVDVTGTALKLGTGLVKYDAKGCPWCGEAMKGTGKNPRKGSLFGRGADAVERKR